MTPELKTCIDLFNQVGIPGIIAIFVWRAFPHLIRWWAESTKQARIVSEAIPRMEQSLHQMATDGNALLREINGKVDLLLERK